MYTCVKGTNVGSVPTVWYFFFFVLFCVNITFLERSL